MSRERRVGRSSGMGLDVESSGAGDGVPPVFWFLLGFRVSDGPVGSEYSTCVLIRSRGSCHIWGTTARRIDAGVRAGPPPRLDGGPFGRIPAPQERRMGDGSVGRPPLDPSIRLRDYRAQGSCLRRNDSGAGMGLGGIK